MYQIRIRTQNKAVLAILIMMMFFVSCAGVTTTPTGLTQKQNITIMMEAYNSQYDDVYSVMTNPSSTPAQKDIARQKKILLKKVWPLLNSYSALISKGGIPTEEDTAAIMLLINQLTALTYGGTKQ